MVLDKLPRREGNECCAAIREMRVCVFFFHSNRNFALNVWSSFVAHTLFGRRFFFGRHCLIISILRDFRCAISPHSHRIRCVEIPVLWIAPSREKGIRKARNRAELMLVFLVFCLFFWTIYSKSRFWTLCLAVNATGEKWIRLRAMGIAVDAVSHPNARHSTAEFINLD